jgi:hypothetical protein
MMQMTMRAVVFSILKKLTHLLGLALYVTLRRDDTL